MKVYKPSKYNNTAHTVFVQPGVDYPETSEWMDAENKPKLFQIFFRNGVAEVEDNLGHYLIDRQIAAPTPLINIHGTAL